MGEQNGIAVHYPKIEVSWNPESQTLVGITFNTGEFKNPLFVAAVLGMAADFMKDQTKLQQIQAMQQQAMAQQEHLAIARKLRTN